MTSFWSSDLFVFKDEGGQGYVSAALPIGVVVPASAIHRYRATGPYMPIGWPKPTKVDDPAAWMAERRNEGFAFSPLAV